MVGFRAPYLAKGSGLYGALRSNGFRAIQVGKGWYDAGASDGYLFELAAQARVGNELREEDLQHQLVEGARRRMFEPCSDRLFPRRGQPVELLVGPTRLSHHSAAREPGLHEPRQDRVQLALRR